MGFFVCLEGYFLVVNVCLVLCVCVCLFFSWERSIFFQACRKFCREIIL